MKKVFFYRADRPIKLSNRNAVVDLLNRLIKEEGMLLTRLLYIFCSDEYLLKINIQFLKHNTFTDVITFSLTDNSNEVNGEVYLSSERIKENAKTFGTTYKNEMLRVIIHAALHLCGYTDKKVTDRKTMKSKENYYMSLFTNFT